jgi:hypothetical protein
MRSSGVILTALVAVLSVVGLTGSGQEPARTNLTVSDIVESAEDLNGQVVTVAGVIVRSEKDGLSGNTFMLVLEGDLKCRLSKELLEGRGRKIDLRSKGQDEIGVYLKGERVLAHGEDVVVRGTLKQEMKKPVLDKVVIKATSNRILRKALGLLP